MRSVTISFVCGIAVGIIIYRVFSNEEDCADGIRTNEKQTSDIPPQKMETANSGSENSRMSAPNSAQTKETPMANGENAEATQMIPQEASMTADPDQRWATRQGLMEIAQEGKELSKDETEKWHTRQGVIDVATDKPYRKVHVEKDELSRFSTRQGVMEVALLPRKEEQVKRISHNQRKGFEIAASLNRKLRKENDAIQVSISNTSNKDREITLWGTDTSLSIPYHDDLEDQQPITEVPVGIHPQALISNPFNSLVYAVNQLSNTVTVCTPQGDIVKTIELLPFGYPGICSPVDLAVHPISGEVYVACSVSNAVCVLSSNLELLALISVGVRPVAIAFNSFNELMYVVNFASNEVSVINTSGLVVLTLPVENEPSAIVVNPVNGDVYIANSLSETITVYSKSNIFITTINGMNNPISLFWHPALQKIYVTLKSENQIVRLDPDTYSIITPIVISHRHRAMVHHPGNGFLYITNQDSESVTILDEQNAVRAVIPAPGINIGFVIHPNQYALLWTSTKTSSLKLTSLLTDSSFIVADRIALNAQLNEFRSHPPAINHVKIIVTGNKSIPNLVIREFTTSGKQNDTAISLSSYESPQHFLRVYEVDAFKGTTIDGFTYWLFVLPASCSVTLLIYYRPTKGNEALIEKALKSNN